MPDGRLFVETVTKRDIYMQIHEKQRDLENAQLYVEEAQSEGRHESGAPFVYSICVMSPISQRWKFPLQTCKRSDDFLFAYSKI